MTRDISDKETGPAEPEVMLAVELICVVVDCTKRPPLTRSMEIKNPPNPPIQQHIYLFIMNFVSLSCLEEFIAFS